MSSAKFCSIGSDNQNSLFIQSEPFMNHKTWYYENPKEMATIKTHPNTQWANIGKILEKRSNSKNFSYENEEISFAFYFGISFSSLL